MGFDAGAVRVGTATRTTVEELQAGLIRFCLAIAMGVVSTALSC
jgi:hypothetical protein